MVVTLAMFIGSEAHSVPTDLSPANMGLLLHLRVTNSAESALMHIYGLLPHVRMTE